MKRKAVDTEIIPFASLPPRTTPLDSYTTTCFDDMFKASCFKNAVCTITTNLRINMNLFVNRVGGQLTSSLPGNRLILVLGGHRYSVICCQTGKFVLTNLFFFNRLKDLYDYFVNFCLMLVTSGVASVDAEAVDGYRELKILFLIENCQFSYRFKEAPFQALYVSDSPSCKFAAAKRGVSLTSLALAREPAAKRVLVELYEFVLAYMRARGHVVIH